MKLTGERQITDKPFALLPADSTSNYFFAKQFTDNAVVLDAGCGYGYGSDYLAKNGAQKVIGVDISPEAIKVAKSKYTSDNLQFQIMDVTNLSFANETFDVVLSFGVIEHLHDYGKYLSEIWRVLKSGGAFVMSTPNRKFGTRPDSRLPANRWHVREFFPEELTQILKRYFTEVQILGMHIVNPRLQREQAEYEQRLRKSYLVRHVPVRLQRRIPFQLKMIFWGYGRHDYVTTLGVKASRLLNPDDLKISEEDIEKAYSLLGLCRK